jgi:predicted CXXCH cytochrome family protein
METKATARFLAFALPGVAAAAFALSPDAYFTHKRHLDSSMGCDNCHIGVSASESSQDNNIPLPEICGDCHDPVPELEFRASLKREMIFSHKMHLAAGLECSTCHSLDGSETEARMRLPEMAVCLSCHKKESQTEKCADCHTGLGSPELVPKSHNRQWLLAHGQEGALDQTYCSNCHQQSFCQECHQGDNIKPRPHRRNWKYTHSIAARKGVLECNDCHEPSSESECLSCHRSPQGRPSSHKRGRWITRHSDEAMVNLEACAMCHLDMANDYRCNNCHESD